MAAASCRRSKSSYGTSLAENGDRLVRRFGIASTSTRSVSFCRTGPPTRTVAANRRSIGDGVSCTIAALPTASTASRRLSTAAPTDAKTSRPAGSSSPGARSGTANTSMRSSYAWKRHGWLLRIDGARVAAVTAASIAALSSGSGAGRVLTVSAWRPAGGAS